jgi:hypothetical protein
MMTQGKRDKARELYVEALDLDSGLALARTAIARLDNPAQDDQSRSESDGVRIIAVANAFGFDC